MLNPSNVRRLVIEPWMLPNEWSRMGGETECRNGCADCISSESALMKAKGDEAQEAFVHHWDSWFTESDVKLLKSYGINTVRIAVGFWIIEDLVMCDEHFPSGGIHYLRKGLKWLQHSNISVILDLHAAPGAQTAEQVNTGQ